MKSRAEGRDPQIDTDIALPSRHGLRLAKRPSAKGCLRGTKSFSSTTVILASLQRHSLRRMDCKREYGVERDNAQVRNRALRMAQGSILSPFDKSILTARETFPRILFYFLIGEKQGIRKESHAYENLVL